ncbi:MAG: hypothetical protein ABIE75_01440, partial [Candidatus Omnitrophota bacterium]
ITQAKSIISKLIAFARYKLAKDKLLNKRDEFIANRIKETLSHSEKGILFLGAYHNVKDQLKKDFLITEVKDVDKVREYQQLLPFYNKKRARFEELKRYLISPVKV